MTDEDVGEVQEPPFRARLRFHWSQGDRLDVRYWPWIRREVLDEGWRRRRFVWMLCPVLLPCALGPLVVSAVAGHFELESFMFFGLLLPISLAAGYASSLDLRAKLLAHQGLSIHGTPLPPPRQVGAILPMRWPSVPPVRGVRAVPFLCGLSALGAIGAAATLTAFALPAGNWHIGPFGVFRYHLDHLDAVLALVVAAGAAVGVVGAVLTRRSPPVTSTAARLGQPRSTRAALAVAGAGYTLGAVVTWLSAGPAIIGAVAIVVGVTSLIGGAALAVWAIGQDHHHDVRIVGLPIVDRNAFVVAANPSA